MGTVDTRLNQDQVPNKHLIMKIVPYIEVYVFGTVSSVLFVIQTMTHLACTSALKSALDDKQIKLMYNSGPSLKMQRINMNCLYLIAC